MKSKSFKILIGLIFLVLFDALFFVLKGSECHASTWWSYLFIHIAYFLLLATPLLGKYGKGYATLQESLYARAFIFFVLELIIGTIFIIANPVNATWAFLIQAVMLGLFLFAQLSGVLVNDTTKQTHEKQKQDIKQIRLMSESVRSKLMEIEDVDVKKQVVQCYEALNETSIVSYPEMQQAEETLRNSVDLLCAAIDSKDNNQISAAASRVLGAVRARNAALRMCQQ